VDFTTVAVGGTTTQTLTVVNVGDVAMLAAAPLVTAEVAGTVPGATFTPDDGGCTGKVLTAYGTASDRCVVTFTATGTALALGGANAIFQVGAGAAAPASPAPSSTYTLQAEVVKAAALTVTAVAATNTFPPTAVTGYTQQDFTIVNGTNTTDFQTSGVVAVTLGGAGATQFQLVGTTCAPNVGLSPGPLVGCTVTVRFAPTALSADGNAITATLNVTATPGSAAPATILGMPKSALTIAAIDTGTIPPTRVMAAQTETFTITKDATAVPTAALDTSITGTDFILVDDQCYGKVLSGSGASATCHLFVKYIGLATTTAKTATLTVNGGSAGQSASVLVSFTGAAATVH
jgi:hypothetical protein